MKWFLAMCATVLFSACARPWRSGARGDAATGDARPGPLAGVVPRAGGHCESSAMMNALLALGYPVTEPMIAGGGGALAFRLERGTFPFIGARNERMREVFYDGAGIAWERRLPGGGDARRAGDWGWAEIRTLLARGVPVVIRTDMRFLPYRYGGKYGPRHLSFGWHMITLFAIDDARETALVSDTEFPGLQEIRLKDLHRARTSRTKVFPPRGEYSWAEPAPAGYTVDWDRLVVASLREVGANSPASLDALSRFGDDLAELEAYGPKPFLVPAVLEYLAGTIEDYGTGGAAFRRLYRDFLAEAATRSRYRSLAAAFAPLDAAIAEWHVLSARLRAFAASYKALSAEGRRAEYAALREIASRLYGNEREFYTILNAATRKE